MPRLPHGQIPGTKAVKASRDELARLSVEVPLGFALTPPVDVHDFDFMFPSLQGNPDNLLPTSTATVAALKQLGRTMTDENVVGEDSPIPAAYTYFGQFVDHDIALEVQPADIPETVSGSLTDLLADDMVPLGPAQIRNALRNFRSATLDLDSVYGLPAPRDPNNGAKMRLGKVAPSPNATNFPRPPGKTDDNDLPREPRRTGNDLHDRAALIGDPRNDENTIISQLHVAFLKAHNKLVDQGRSFEEAQRLLRQHYQHIVIYDFLRKRVVGSSIVDDILLNGNRWFDALGEPFFMPLEFANAAYRFGHTMVRAAYNFNLNFNFRPGGIPATLELLFTFSALSGQLGNFETLPEHWIIEWENLIGEGSGVGKARRIDTKLAATGNRALFNLRNLVGQPEEPQPDASRLAVRNLLRGYRLRIPTGQAVANFLELPVMTAAEIEAAATTSEQVQALQAGGFSQKTPLWYYILAEAKHYGSDNLGPVGGTIVAEVLIGLIRRSEDSILRSPGWFPSLPQSTPGVFELQDLLRFADVLPQTAVAPRLYTVKAGDTLSKIAREQLGNTDRWTEIFVLNRAIIRHPDRIFVGQVLTLPTVPITPRPRIYVVRRGDTLAGIARAQLRNTNRWPEIFARNRDVLGDPNRIIPDQVLLLPPN